MKLFVCTDHDSHWPVGCASIVFAENETRARELLNMHLVAAGLKPFEEQNYTLEERPTDGEWAEILHDGNY